MHDGLHQFQAAIRAAGLEPPEIIEPGKLQRFPGVGKRHGNTAGWCKLFDDGQGGCFGDFSSGLSEHWQVKQNKPFTSAERRAFRHRVARARAQADVDRKASQERAATKASTIWGAATVADAEHPYLLRKGIKTHGAMMYKGSLVIPVRNFDGKLTSLQFIDPNGRKLLLSGGRKRGCFIPVAGNAPAPSRVIICEGWATGCSLAEDEPAALVIAAIDAGNIKPVAVNARSRWPSATLVIAGDDDRLTQGNPGARMARAAAIASNALLSLPEWPEDAPEALTDFNDLARWQKGVWHD